MLHRLLQRIYRVLFGGRDTHENANTDGQGDGPDNTSNRSQPPSRPATEPHTPTPPEPTDETIRGDGHDVDTPDADLDIEYPPYIGADTSMSPSFPDPPADPVGTIEVNLYWQEDWQYRACNQCVRYVEYCLLDAYSPQGFDVDVQVYPEPIPSDATSYDAFKSWYWGLDGGMAKDANIALVDYGGVYGEAGGYGGWINPSFFQDWGRDPDDAIKNVGGDGGQDGPTFGISVLLHEIGHCLGLGHMPSGDNKVRAWGDTWVSPMDAGYENSDATRYIFEYHPALKDNPPKVQPPD